METVDSTYGSFALSFTDRGYVWYFAIHPEMYPAAGGIAPTGNYFTYCTHPTRGSVSFILEQDEECHWTTEISHPFISREIIDWLGRHIESRCR